MTGRVVFEGNLDDPRLRKYFEDLHLHAPLTLKEAKKGVEPRMVNVIPNETLIVDPKSQGVKNALVYLKTRPKQVHPELMKQPLAPVELTFQARIFTPRVFAMRVGQEVVMSADKIHEEATNFHSGFTRNDNFNILITPNGPKHKWIPKNPEPMPSVIRSDIYRSAVAYCLVQDHPYVAVTDHQGGFELKNLPAGTHELAIWHETVGFLARSLKVKVNPDKTNELPPNAVTTRQLLR